MICLSNNSSEIEPWEISRKIADIYLADKLDPESEIAPAADSPQQQGEPTVAELRNMVGAYRSEDRRIWRVSFKNDKLQITDHQNET